MSNTWEPPSPDTVFVCYDEQGVPARMCLYMDILAEIDVDLWPTCQYDFDLLMFAYNAELCY